MALRRGMGFLHRWVGLFIAGFLVISGATGAIISWNEEIDGWLNRDLMEASSRGDAMSGLDMAALIERRDPRVNVVSIPLAFSEGSSAEFEVVGKINPETSQPYDIGYNEVFIDPVTGNELGRRDTEAVWPITRNNLTAFLYNLHFTLHSPEIFGTDLWGMWLLGIVALLWAVDCFVGFYLTLPAKNTQVGIGRANVVASRTWWSRWKTAWKIKKSGSSTRLNMDIHRALSLWLWALLFVIAFTAFSQNLYREVFYPIMSTFSKVTPDPFSIRTPNHPQEPIIPKVGYREIMDLASAEAKRRKMDIPPGSIVYDYEFGIYAVHYHPAGEYLTVGGGRPPSFYYDGLDGRLLGDRLSWEGTAADIFLQIQFPLHSGRIIGLPGRVLMSVMGIAVAVISITGVIIWSRKRRAKLKTARVGRLAYP